MSEQIAKFSTASILLAVFCFLLPFATFSCPAMPEISFNLQGIDLAGGTTVQIPDGFGGTEEQQFDAEPLAFAALVLLVVALVFSLGRARIADLAALLLPVTASMMLLGLRQKMVTDALEEASGMVRVDFRIGLWGAVVLGGAAGALRLLHLRLGERLAGDRPSDSPRRGDPGLPEPRAAGVGAPVDQVTDPTP